MTIKDYIQTEVILPRLKEKEILVVYDPHGRYRDLCLELATADTRVVDTTTSSITSREEALTALQQLGSRSLKYLLVYVPVAAPTSDEARQRDPFAIYSAAGATFPAGDGDEYLNLCLKARPDHATEIRRIFAENPGPDFAVIDAVGGGAGWPQLQTLLGVESARNILFALLVPSADQQAALKRDKTWASEARELLATTLGLRLITRAQSWDAIAAELWRYLLFSEFTYDLPVALPPALADVPCAPVAAQPLVEDLCDRLRHDQRTQPEYINRAEKIEEELNLKTACAAISDLGVRDTFPFEERTFFAQAVEALQQDNLDRPRQILANHKQSVWVDRGENQVQWRFLTAAVNLVEACADVARELPAHVHAMDALIDFYVGRMRNVDRLQREFEQAAGDIFNPDASIDAVTRQARAAYHSLSSSIQTAFVRHLEKTGWPPPGRLANVDIFDQVVAPKLQASGHRVALFLIDALRYELGVELHKELTDQGQVELQPAFAPLPSATPVGMAALLPEAGAHLRLTRRQDKMVPALGDQPLPTVAQRLDVLRRRYGQRFADAPLNEFARGKTTPPPETDLFVIRSNEMDSDFESNPEGALSQISRTFQQIRAALRRLQDLNFQEALVLTDHGFYLNPGLEAGDVCSKPGGTWIAVHDRLLLGDGTADAGSFTLPATQLGIRGDFNQAAGPRALVAYRAGQVYFHGGASLPETLVPVITVQLRAQPDQAAESFAAQPQITISYKRGGSTINTLLPVFELTAGPGDFFSRATPIELLLEAQDKKGAVVGEAKGEAVNLTTGTITIHPGATLKVTLRMDDAFEGKFTVKALDPNTLTTYSKLDMQTNYTR